MASVVFEWAARQHESPEIVVLPGISALQAAAARCGAPLSHDFAAISLSDLLTPWPLIEKRLQAAIRADFVLALYNPRSQRRQKQWERAQAIIRTHCSPRTPVGIVRNAFRDGESVVITDVAHLEPVVKPCRRRRNWPSTSTSSNIFSKRSPSIPLAYHRVRRFKNLAFNGVKA